MPHWPFIIACYVLTIGGTAAMAAWSYAAMRARENKAAVLREGRDQ
jgi:formate-dependent nitrite reductase membrane component NrfD